MISARDNTEERTQGIREKIRVPCFIKTVEKLLVYRYPLGVYNQHRIRRLERMKENCCCNVRTKERSPEEYKDLVNRLSRIEGQIRGLKRMVEEGAYCPDILNQSAAASAALSSFNRVLMSNHIKSCVIEDVRAGNDETVDELLGVLQKLMK